jgi:uncharacterized protein (DUF885 family)
VISANFPTFSFCSDVVDRLAALDPLMSTELGFSGLNDQLPDWSPAGEAAQIALLDSILSELDTIEVTSDDDRRAASILRERVSVFADLARRGESARTFSVLSSPISSFRQVLELVDVSHVDEQRALASRLRALPAALEGLKETWVRVKERNELPALRHIEGVAAQAEAYGSGGLTTFAAGVPASAEMADELKVAAQIAEEACTSLAQWMRSELAPFASASEAAGRDRYELWTRQWTGARLDLDEVYHWGWQELSRLTKRMWEIAATVAPEARSLSEVAAVLDRKPRHSDSAAKKRYSAKLRTFTDEAVEKMRGTHFDIDDRIAFCDARLAPEGTAAGAFYIPPSEDLSRPGTTWFSTLGENVFYWWRHASTWYHEAVPGHHLQCATAILASDRQSRFQRLIGWTSGYGEGWALYAERLSEELGYFSDLGDEMGYLSNQALRAARVVVDIGLHLQLAAPSDLGELSGLGDCSGRVWTPAMAVAVLEEHALRDHVTAVSEVDRYLGWPGQAISYKVGERVWLEVRDEARRRHGEAFDLKAFHKHSLEIGAMGLDAFRQLMADF